MINLREIEWGGSGIEEMVFGFILGTIWDESTIIELGAGHVSTPALSEYYDLHSVEHDEQFINCYDKPKYIHAPLVNDWYDRKILEEKLPENASLLLIDGINREKILDHLDLFQNIPCIIVHDTYREKEKKLAFNIAGRLGKSVKYFANGDHWAFIK